MNRSDRQVLRIDINFGFCMAAYCASSCAISGFAAVYLSYFGMSNTGIGLTTSLGCALSVLLQLVVSDYLDKHPSFQIKRMTAALFLAGLTVAACLHFISLPVFMMAAAYMTVHALELSESAYLSAQLVQFNNVGIPAHFGWPRSFGSLAYAGASYLFGMLAERYTPAILMPCYMIMSVLCIIAVMLMPVPKVPAADAQSQQAPQQTTSYREMISHNPALIVFMISMLLYSIGNKASYGFTIRLFERLGYGTFEYGISELIRAASELPILILSGVLLKRFRSKTLLAASFLFFGIRILAMATAPSLGYLYTFSALNMFSTGLYLFSMVLYVNSIVGPGEKVRGQSLAILCTSVGSILGNLCGGIMIDTLGLQAMMITSSLFCFAAWAGLAFLSGARVHENE